MNEVAPVLVLGLLLAYPLQAHDLWVTSKGDGYAVMRGQLPHRFDPYDPTCVRTLSAFDAGGHPLPLKRLDRKQRVLPRTPPDPALVTVVSKWGHRVIDGDGKKRFMSKAEAVEAGIVVEETFFSTQYSKTLFRFHETFTKPLKGLVYLHCWQKIHSCQPAFSRLSGTLVGSLAPRPSLP